MSESGAPLLSVVMTVFNGERFLREAIDSVLAQTYTDFELVVVDDASTDTTPRILASYRDPRVKVVTNCDNVGPYVSANRGLGVTHGKLIARHDADDVSLPDRFHAQIERMTSQPSLVLLGTSYHVVDASGRILDTALMPAQNDELQRRLEYGTIFLHGTIMVRREALNRIGGYREFFRVSQDYDLFLRLAEVGEIANLPEPHYLFRFHGASMSRNKRALQLACRRFAWRLAVQRREGQDEDPVPVDVVESYPPEPIRLFRDARGTAYLHYAAGNVPDATEALQYASRLQREVSEEVEPWSEWLLDRARHLVQNRDRAGADGAAFIEWTLDTLPSEDTGNRRKCTLAKYYADRAFAAYQAGERARVVKLAQRAVHLDSRWIGNRGLWSITVRSLVPWGTS